MNWWLVNFLDVWSKRLIAKAWEKKEAKVKQIFLKDRKKISQRQANTKKTCNITRVLRD